MTIHPIVILGQPVLHTRAAEVEAFDDDLEQLVADMFDTLDASNGVGLAAPQIGVGKRIFVYDMQADDGTPRRGVFVNPRIATSKVPGTAPDKDDEAEGCLSAPGEHFPLKRADWARVNGVDQYGAPVEIEARDWFARCMQHEYDHLDGKLYIDRLNARWAKRAKKTIKANGWGVPGLTWMPGVDPDPFGH
ncbi:peptide deformylase [Spelaeicoccus albus]|uniref:Peptide deformylase n=1 Tax=Spelaeicoccus albus TaxID=1280376 RepID=A0A7Z0D2G6_9MICO|nr:peptide deformylase [Spelaeicoccus albus]NYI67661.1 peptide deformylase [Spelaeicoccus albus]